MRLLYRLLSLFFLLLTSFHVLAIDEHYAAPGLSGNQLAPDSTSLVMDTVYFNPSLKPIQTTFTVKNLITFQINEAYRHMLPNEFNVSITFVVHYTYDDGGTAVNDVSDPITLNLDYSIYTKYGFKNAYVMDGWEKAQIEITSISSDVDFNTIKDGLLLTNEILVNREYNFSCSSNAVQTINTSTSYVSSKGELKVYWSPQRAADEYDLEWSYIDSAALANYYVTGSTTTFDPKKIFPKNATRVSIATTEYYIPLLYEGRGTLFYRVRAVQVKGNNQRIESVWSSDYSGGLGQYDFLGLDTTLNWQASTSFAEDGKRKSVVQYFDGSLKSRQTVTKDNTTDTTVVAETFYDYQGKPVIQVMPTPSLSSIIKFTPNFNRINGAEYTKDLYDGLLQDSCYCTVGAPAMDSGYGAAKYYSANNSQVSSGYNKYIPKARGFAFAETRYTPDNTGRISIQGAVGDTFQIGKGHETRYTYSSANQEEIDALFGTEVGNSSHYFKNTVLDANGQYSISYVDMHGRTIATALAGKPAMQLDTLTSNKTVYITKKLLDSSTNIIKGTVIESSKGLIVTKAGSHRFIYSMVPDSISIKACDSSSVCYDCIYDLKITITDECNNSTFTGHQPIVINRNNYSRISQNCSQADSFPAVDTTVYLREGSYTVTKTLTINQQAFDYYRDSVFLVRNTCKTLQQTIAAQRVALDSTVQCAPTCASCLAAIGSWDTFRNNYMLSAGIPTSDTANHRMEAQLAWNKQQAECDLLCNNTALHKSIRQQMLADITPPYGQYANPDSIDIFSVFWTTGPSGPYPQPSYATVSGTYVDESGHADPLNPKSLNQTDFIQEFKSSWADTLLKQHPEYPKLVKFEQLAASNYWDDRFEATDTYQAAVDSGFLNPGNFSTHPTGSIFAYNSTHRDPFFTDLSGGVVGAFYKSRMQDSLVTKAKDTSGGSISMWSLATIMAHCPDTSNIACLYHYKPIDSAFAIGSSCSADLDAAWRYFREMYLQTKRIFIGQMLDTAQATSGGRFPDLTELAANHKPAFYDPAISTTGDMATNASAGRDSLNKFISDNCTAYADLWWNQLSSCSFANDSAAKAVIIPRLIQVCKEGGDSAHLFGSSTVKPTSSYTYKSFEDVIKAYRDSTGKPYNGACNAYLITSPVPYDHEPVYYDKPIYKKPDSCECSTINSLYQQYQWDGKDTSFAAYLYRTSGTVMRQGALDTLRMACNGGIDCSFLPSPLSLPPVLQCGVKNVCVNCARIDTLYNHYVAKFPDAMPQKDENDSLQRSKNMLFEMYMNAQLGFNKTTSDYLQFMDACGTTKPNMANSNIALNFNDTIHGRRIRIPVTTNSRLNLGYSDLTFEARIKPKPNSPFNTILCNRTYASGANADGCLFRIDNSSNLLIQLQGCYNYSTTSTGGINLYDGKAHHIAVTRQSDSLAFYIDGVKLPYTITCSSGLTTPPSQRNITTSGPWFIGLDSTGASPYPFTTFNGWISEVRIWNKARTQDEIQNNITTRLTPQDGLVGYYLMTSNDTCSQTVIDYSTDDASQRNNGILGTTSGKEIYDPIWLSTSQISFNSNDPTGVVNTCNCSDSVSNALINQQTEFRKWYYEHNRHYDSNGCDSANWKFNYGGYLNTTGIPHTNYFKNGILQYPDTLGTGYPHAGIDYDFLNRDSACLQSHHMSLEFRVKHPHLHLELEWHFNVNNFDDYAHEQFFYNAINVNTNNAYVQFVDNGNAANDRTIYDPVMVRDFSYWRRIKFEVQDSVLKYYVDDTLLRSFNFPSTLSLNKFMGVSFGSQAQGELGAAIDWVKAYDSNGKLFWFEDFNDCSNFNFFAPYIECPRAPCTTAFAGYYNKNQGTNYTYTQLDSLYRAHNIALNICDTLGHALTLCGNADAVFAPTTIIQHQPCDDSTLFATSVARLLQDAYTDSITGSFNDRYLAKCLKARYNESFTVYQPVSEYHYTLYYYDQAGNLIKTVPPAGVDVSKFAWASTWSDSVTSARRNKQRLTPAHTLVTQYRFNTLNQPVAQQSPDGGLTEFWYDRLGRLVISRNAHQKAVSTTENNRYYSYTQYDSLGRITEVGQVSNTTTNGAMTDSISRNSTLLNTWLVALTSKRSQITNTIYDLPYPGLMSGIGDTRLVVTQRNLRNRVSYTTLTDTGTSTAYNQATFYTYDILGNVDTLLQDFGSSSFTATANVMNKNNNRWKKIAYKYDLISGKVNMVMYQRGWRDGFYHRYSYDAENRLTLVETSSDSLVWETEAKYDYYRHGPLARITLGHQQVQGMDYAYTLQGWLKGINSTGGTAKYDMGTDAYGGSINQFVGKDAIGLTLNYFANDYTGINGAPFPGYSAFIGSSYRPLYNGNISSMSVYQKRFEDNTFPGGPLIFYAYKYDQLNRLTGQDAFKGSSYNSTTNAFDSLPTMGQYLKERIAYDANGNISRYLRNSISGTTAGMDSLTYKYYTGTNRLRYIKDSVTSAYLSDPNNLIWDLKSQSDSNYVYDEIGNLVKDNKDSLTSIKWNVYGKITEINRIASTSKPATKIQFTYDALGNRISQIVTTATDKAYTWFVRDAQGNVLSTYTTNGTSTDLTTLGLNQTELYLYGSSRIGVRNLSEGMGGTGPDDLQYYHNFNYDRGWKRYELANHLGNVLATISDRKLAVPSDTNSSLISYYVPDIVSAQDYYPFGMLSRVAVAGDGSSYRFGFNGKMNDNDVMGLGNEQDYGMRIYDPRVGRFLSVDPITSKYPELTPYQFSSNRPIDGIDQDGLEHTPATGNRDVTAVQSGMDPEYVMKRMMEKNKAKQSTPIGVINSGNATLSQGPAPGSWGANESARLKQQDDINKEYASRADLDPVGFGVAHTTFSAANEYVKGVSNHAYGVYEGVEEKNAGKVAGNTLLLGLDVSPFITKGLGASAPEETFYRTMSADDFASFQKTGNLPATGETFISPTAQFSSDYSGVLVQINTKGGTLKQLENIGVRNVAKNHPNPNLPIVQSGWNKTNAFFKLETNSSGLQQVNIGLGKGNALQIFNNNIKSFKAINKP